MHHPGLTLWLVFVRLGASGLRTSQATIRKMVDRSYATRRYSVGSMPALRIACSVFALVQVCSSEHLLFTARDIHIRQRQANAIKYQMRVAIQYHAVDCLCAHIEKRFAAIGIASGLITYALAATSLRAAVLGVQPWDPISLAASTLLLIATAAVASWLPARHAAAQHPALALRAE